MTAFCCPYCRAVLAMPAEQRGATVVCSQCRRQVSAARTSMNIQAPETCLDPLAPPATADCVPPLEAIKDPTRDVPTVLIAHQTGDALLARSAALRREMVRFADEELPDLSGL